MTGHDDGRIVLSALEITVEDGSNQGRMAPDEPRIPVKVPAGIKTIGMDDKQCARGPIVLK